MSSPSPSRKRKLEITRDWERRAKQAVSTRAHRSGAEQGLYHPTTTAVPRPAAGRQPQPRVVGAALGNRPEANPASANPSTVTASARPQAYDASDAQVESELQRQVERTEQPPQDPAGELDDMETTSTSSSPTTASSVSISDEDEEVKIPVVKQEVGRFLSFVLRVLPKEPSVTFDGSNYRTWRKVIL
jgi:hypothetical protein